MERATEENVKKLGIGIRILAGLIFLCGLIATAGIIYALLFEPFDSSVLVAIVVIGVMQHISGSVTFRGFAPKYLLFAHGSK